MIKQSRENINSFKCLVMSAKDLTDMHNNYDVSTVDELNFKRELKECIEEHNKEFNDILQLEYYKNRYYITKKRGGLI